LAVLRAIESEAVIDNARSVGDYLLAAVRAAVGDQAMIGDVRGWGMAVGIDVRDTATGRPDAITADAIVNAMRARGVLIGTTGPESAVLKIRPPLVLGRSDVDDLVTALSEALRATVQGLPS
jgi:4-aminobutyrate aminotransferase-like enzyme